MTTSIIKRTGICLILATSVISCTTTITKTKSPVFASADSLQAGLNRLVACQNFNLKGKEVTTGGKDVSELEIDVVNGKDIPADNEQMGELGKKLASYIKKALKDSKEYDSYKVLFVTKTITNGVTSRTWVGRAFRSEEL